MVGIFPYGLLKKPGVLSIYNFYILFFISCTGRRNFPHSYFYFLIRLSGSENENYRSSGFKRKKRRPFRGGRLS